MYVWAICWACSLSTWDQLRPKWLYYSHQILPTKLGQSLVMTITRAQYLVEWKDIVAVSIVFLERGRRGSGNGTRPCFTKRIMKTKQFWQVWRFEDTSVEIRRLSESSCLSKGLRLDALCAFVIEKIINSDTWLALLKVATIRTKLPSFYCRWDIFLNTPNK